ncbi:MAG: DUF3108 domain-containing protein [Bacteroidota bacterium]
MVRRIYLVLIGICLLSFTGRGGFPPGPLQEELPSIDNHTFRQGEFLKYRIHYGFITAGFATLEVMPERYLLQDRVCWHIVGKGYTHPGYDWIYKIRDQYETYIDRESLLSWRFNRHIREGGFENYTETYFNHYTYKAEYINEWKQITVYDVPANIQDVISAFYHARTTHTAADMKVGDKISLRNFLDRKTFDLEAEMLARDTVKIGGMSYKTLKFNLLIEEAGLITDGSKIQFWISDDHNKVPLRIKSDLMIGSLKADLIEWDNLMYELRAL